MFGRLAKCMLAIALIFSLGGHWAVLQVAAWASMTVSFSQTESLSTALNKTFDGNNPCKMCKIVKEGKAAEKKSESGFEVKKMDVLFAVLSDFCFPPLTLAEIDYHSERPLLSLAPLAPPPRSVC